MTSINPLAAASTANSQTDTTTSTTSKTSGFGDALSNEQTFLKLLVSQVQNQNPLNPSDPVQFLSQLTQFSQLEQLMSIRQELSPATAGTTTPATNS